MDSHTVYFPGESGRLAAELHLPSDLPGPAPGVIVCPGMGSRKERHAEFGRFLAGEGFAALVLDLRGHGESDGALDAETVNDVRAAAAYFRTRPEVDGDRIAVRGSSLGGHFAIHAGARFPDVIKAVVAVCPAPEDVILPYVLDVDPEEIASAPELGYRLNKPDFLRYLREASIFEAVARISPRPILLIHARGDEDIPYRHTERLYAEAGEPKTLLLVDDGHHSSAQHDLDVHRVTCDWLRKALGGR